MGNIIEINGVIVGNNGDVILSESKFEDLLIESGFKINRDDGSTLIFDYAFDLGFFVICLYSDSDDYHFAMRNYDLSNLEENNKEIYDAINQLIDDYIEKC